MIRLLVWALLSLSLGASFVLLTIHSDSLDGGGVNMMGLFGRSLIFAKAPLVIADQRHIRIHNGLEYVQVPVSLFSCEKWAHGLAPHYPASFLHSLSPSTFPHKRQDATQHQVPPVPLSEGNEGLTDEDEGLLDHVLRGLTVPSAPCRRMVMMGGSYCTGRKEGEKIVCFDPGLEPSLEKCLVYSFGVGHEISFDKAVGTSYGCQVLSFDSDYNHAKYPTEISPNVLLIKVRLSWRRRGRFPFVYRPLDDLMLTLGHEGATLDILKLDIENFEWDIFEKSIFKTGILENTKQLALELHLVSLDPNNTIDPHPGGWRAGLRQHARVLQGLQDRGFRLAYYEPNYNAPENATLLGRTFHMFFETVWLNTRFEADKETPSTLPTQEETSTANTAR